MNVSAQVALPDWVRGRGLAMFVASCFGAMAAGSAIWGLVADMVRLQAAQFIAAADALAAIPLTWRWKLQTGAGVDHTPSIHWPEPIVTHEVERDHGEVLVTVEYRIDRRDRGEFLAAMDQLGYERRRNGAYGWGVFERNCTDRQRSHGKSLPDGALVPVVSAERERLCGRYDAVAEKAEQSRRDNLAHAAGTCSMDDKSQSNLREPSR